MRTRRTNWTAGNRRHHAGGEAGRVFSSLRTGSILSLQRGHPAADGGQQSGVSVRGTTQVRGRFAAFDQLFKENTFFADAVGGRTCRWMRSVGSAQHVSGGRRWGRRWLRTTCWDGCLRRWWSFWRCVASSPGRAPTGMFLPEMQVTVSRPAARSGVGLWREGAVYEYEAGERPPGYVLYALGPGGWEAVGRLAMRIPSGNLD